MTVVAHKAEDAPAEAASESIIPGDTVVDQGPSLGVRSTLEYEQGSLWLLLGTLRVR